MSTFLVNCIIPSPVKIAIIITNGSNRLDQLTAGGSLKISILNFFQSTDFASLFSKISG